MGNKIESSIFEDIRAGIKDGLAPGLSVVPVGLAYGILAQEVGLSFWQTSIFSAAAVAGQAQLAVLNLMAYSGLSQMFIAAAMVSFRFILISAALSRYLRQTRRIWFPFLAFGVVTVTLGQIISRHEKYVRIETYMFTIQTTFIIFWVLGGMSGYLLPGILPPDLQKAIGFAFPALLIAMVVNFVAIAKPTSEAVLGYFIAFVAGLLALAFYFISPTWSIPLAAVTGATVGVLLKWKQC